ncbi:hypothetical protein FRACA_1560003 [Frankia canadensis]|uniref:Uncharacterized protein n=1 Tax=Frankia canadensis TaxID=1836972 RepID=A0A2I2KMB4_9ACTN|nr:hypothetical protein [Frankia canadensis]SNQ46793.1 hypothetical protein FRACA_1560003 [Frankia canadensis]SOU54083.1 hypothetical protein FRACA_1560003 [Frankia canadensis]
MPVDPATFNSTVIVSGNNVSAGADGYSLGATAMIREAASTAPRQVRK